MLISSSLATDISSEVAKTTPIAMLIGASVTGWGPQDWMYVLGAAYIVLQAAYLAWKWRKEVKGQPDDTDSAGA